VGRPPLARRGGHRAPAHRHSHAAHGQSRSLCHPRPRAAADRAGLFPRRRRAHVAPAHRLRLARPAGPDHLPDRCLGDAAFLHRPPARHPADPPLRRARRPRRRARNVQGARRLGGHAACHRSCQCRGAALRWRRRRACPRDDGSAAGRHAALTARRNPLDRGAGRLADRARHRRRAARLAVRGGRRPRADHRLRARAADRPAQPARALLQGRGRLRRHGSRGGNGARALRPGAPARRGPADRGNAADPAWPPAGAHPQRQQPDLARFRFPSLRRPPGDAEAARQGRCRQRGLFRHGRRHAAAARLRQAYSACAHRAAAHPRARRQCEAARGAGRWRR
jgi:hypothetical protein